MQLPLIPADKGTHIVAGATITLLTAVVFKDAAIGVAVGCSIGALKEGFDKAAALWQAHKGEPVTHGAELLDFIATSIGAVFTGIALVV